LTGVSIPIYKGGGMRNTFLILLLSTPIGCEPGGDLIVVNDRSEEMKIYRYVFYLYKSNSMGLIL